MMPLLPELLAELADTDFTGLILHPIICKRAVSLSNGDRSAPKALVDVHQAKRDQSTELLKR
jgi:hypothetical protein